MQALTDPVQAQKPPEHRLSQLDLRGCFLNDEAASAMASLIRDYHSRLKSLNLSDHLIGPTGAADLAQALRHP